MEKGRVQSGIQTGGDEIAQTSESHRGKIEGTQTKKMPCGFRHRSYRERGAEPMPACFEFRDVRACFCRIRLAPFTLRRQEAGDAEEERLDRRNPF